MRRRPLLLLDLGLVSCAKGSCQTLLQRLEKFCSSEQLVLLSSHSLAAITPPSLPQLVLVRLSLQSPINATIRQLRNLYDRVPILALFCNAPESSLEVLKILDEDIDDFVTCPGREQDLTLRLQRLLRMQRNGLVTQHAWRSAKPVPLESMVGQSVCFKRVLEKIPALAQSDSTVLITGETGTGKELVARALHFLSRRSGKPFQTVNCAAIPDGLVESEFFGYQKGAFTGASVTTEGKLQGTNGGTIVLDEIGDMSLHAQAKVLRVIESREFTPLGTKKNQSVDLRILAATNQDLERAVSDGKFRIDLYYRLSVARIHLPPLRERREDVPLLLAHYVHELSTKLSLPVEGFSQEVIDCLVEYDWPGNVRELRNLVEATIINNPQGRQLEWPDLPELYKEKLLRFSSNTHTERNRLVHTLISTNWNKRKAAGILHCSRMTIYRKLAKYHLEIPVASPKERSSLGQPGVTAHHS